MGIYEVYVRRFEFPPDVTIEVKLQWLLSWFNSKNPLQYHLVNNFPLDVTAKVKLQWPLSWLNSKNPLQYHLVNTKQGIGLTEKKILEKGIFLQIVLLFFRLRIFSKTIQ